jgi:hypothetical protein
MAIFQRFRPLVPGECTNAQAAAGARGRGGGGGRGTSGAGAGKANKQNGGSYLGHRYFRRPDLSG